MAVVLIVSGNPEDEARLLSDFQKTPWEPRALGGQELSATSIDGVELVVVTESRARACSELKSAHPALPILLLVNGTLPKQGPFDCVLRAGVPGPVIRSAASRLVSVRSAPDLERWRVFYRELKAELDRVPEKDYYQILGLKQSASAQAVVTAFDRFTARYHPDKYNGYAHEKWGKAIFDLTNQLYSEMTEAFGVLSSPRTRKRYDKVLAKGQIRMSDDEKAAQSDGPQNWGDAATHHSSRKFLRLAQQDWASSNWQSAIQNLSFAASMEPDNEFISGKLSEAQEKLG